MGSVRVEHSSINSCLTPVVALHGLAVTTIEVSYTPSHLKALQYKNITMKLGLHYSLYATRG